jgi:hypothetical protein
MSKIDPDQLHYLQSVLGIGKVIMPAGSPMVESPPRPAAALETTGDFESARLIVLWAHGARDPGEQAEAQALAEKMVTAMKVPGGIVFWMKWPAACAFPLELPELLSKSGGRPVLVFGAETLDGLKVSPASAEQRFGRWLEIEGSGAKALATHSPEELLTSADKKKLAWAHLQIVMKELK